MRTSFTAAAESYLRAKSLSRGTCNEYRSTLRKWGQWGHGVPIERLQRKHVREFLDWVYKRAVAGHGTNPGRTANKAREHLRAVLSWSWEQEMIDAPPRFPQPRPVRDVAGRHYLTKAELNALYIATHRMRRPKGWDDPLPVGRYWRAALVMFLNYGVDTGTVWKAAPAHEPVLWRHVSWDSQSPDREVKERSRWGWLFYRRVKTGKAFCRPMNRAVHAHIRSIMPADPRPDQPVFLGGGARPNARFQALRELAGIGPRANVETGKPEPWELKDLRKTCATYYAAHVPKTSVEILGHSVGGITYRHYVHRAPLAIKAIMALRSRRRLPPWPAGSTGSAPAAGGDSPTRRKAGRGDRSATRPADCQLVRTPQDGGSHRPHCTREWAHQSNRLTSRVHLSKRTDRKPVSVDWRSSSLRVT